MKNQRLYLYGAGGHAKVVIEIAEQLGVPIAGLVDADPTIGSLAGYSVSTIPPENEDAALRFLVSIGNNAERKKIAGQLPSNEFAKLVHPQAVISKRATIGEGSVVMAGVSINASATIGKHCIINTNASVDHDCIIDDFVHISPNVALGGEVEVGAGTHIGIGASVIQCVKIGRWCTIGAGAVIIRDVPDGATVVGNPGRIIRIKPGN